MTRGNDRLHAPYPGLRPFEPREAPLFYGRGTHIVGMLKVLRRQGSLAVVGASGCGKSSLVRAGLLPALASGYLGSSDADWHFVIMKPGGSPFNHLARALVEESRFQATDATIAHCESTLRRGPKGLIDAIDRFIPLQRDRHVLVLVDQFEEIFQFTHRRRDADPHEQRVEPEGLDDAIAFVDLLLSTPGKSQQRLFVALTLRSDFLGDCDAFRDLPEAINRSQFLTPRLTREELRDAIERPPQNPQFDGPPDEGETAIKSGVEPRVVAELLAAMGDRQDQLPLVQHALMRMWSVAEGREGARPAHIDLDVMRRCGMQDRGSVTGALDQHAEQIYRDLGEEEETASADPREKLYRAPSRRQEIARRLFCELCQQGGDGRWVRRVTRVEDIAATASDDVSADDVGGVAAEFARHGCNFLSVTPPGEITPTSQLDISHESVIRNWKRLQRWLVAEEESASLYRRLAESARLHAEEKEELLTGRALEVAKEWIERNRPTAAWGERYAPGAFERSREFLDHSISICEKRKAEEAREEREKEQARRDKELAKALGRKASRFRQLALITAALAAVAIVLAFVAYKARDRADQDRDLADKARKLADWALAENKVEAARSQAATLMAGLGGAGVNPSRDEYEFLGLLADSEKSIRHEFVEQLFTYAGKAERLRDRYPHLLQALICLDAEEKAWLEGLLTRRGAAPDNSAAIEKAIAELGVHLAGGEASVGDSVVAALLDDMSKTSDTSKLVAFGNRLAGLGERLSGEQAAVGGRHIVKAMERPAAPADLAKLGYALAMLAPRLSEEQNLSGARQLIAAMKRAAGVGNAPGKPVSGERNPNSAQQVAPPTRQVSEIDLLRPIGKQPPIPVMPEVGEGVVTGKPVKGVPVPDSPASAGVTSRFSVMEFTSALDAICGRLPDDQKPGMAQLILPAAREATDRVLSRAFGQVLQTMAWTFPTAERLPLAEQIADILETKRDAPESYELVPALGALSKDLASEQAPAFAQLILDSMSRTSVPLALSDLGSVLGSMREGISEEQASTGSRLILTAMDRTEDPEALFQLAGALHSLNEKLPNEQAVAGARRVLALLKQSTEITEFVFFCRALGILRDVLTEEQARDGSQLMVAAMEGESELSALNELGDALGTLREKIPEEQAWAGAQLILAAMDNTTAFSTRALGGLSDRLSDPHAAEVARDVVDIMEKTDEQPALNALSTALYRLPGKLKADEVLRGALRLVAALGESVDQDVREVIEPALGRLIEALTGSQSLTVAERIIQSAERSRDTGLGSILNAASPRLTGEQAMHCVRLVVAAMKRMAGSDKGFGGLEYALPSLSGRLDDDSLPEFILLMQDAMGHTADSNALYHFSVALGSLGKRLSKEQAAAAADRILFVMNRPTAPSALTDLGEALGSLGESLPEDRAVAGAQKILTAMEGARDPRDFSEIAYAFGGLGGKLPPAEAASGVNMIVTAMKATKDPWTLSDLSWTVAEVGKRLPGKQSLTAAQSITSILEGTTDANALSSLSNAIRSLSENLAAEQLGAFAQLTVTALEATGGQDAESGLFAQSDGRPVNALVSVLCSLAARMELRETASVLKSLPCVGYVREAVLGVLESRADREFHGDVWQAVDWLEKQGVDVRNAPRWPIRDEE